MRARRRLVSMHRDDVIGVQRAVGRSGTELMRSWFARVFSYLNWPG